MSFTSRVALIALSLLVCGWRGSAADDGHPGTADPLAWSVPVNGLTARIENVSGGQFLVRLKNGSPHSLRVPTGNPLGAKVTLAFELYVRNGSGQWRAMFVPTDPGNFLTDNYCPQAGNGPTTRPQVALQPGEDAIAIAVGFDEHEEDSGQRQYVKAVVVQPAGAQQGHWSGRLETPSRPLSLPYETREIARPGIVPFPNHLPDLSFGFTLRLNMVPGRRYSDLYERHLTNAALINTLKLYQRAAVCKEFERRMRAETEVTMKLLLASIAGAAGSAEDVKYLQVMAKQADFRTVRNVSDALQLCYDNFSWYAGDKQPPAPDWLVELSLSILDDRRHVTNDQSQGFEGPQPVTVASLGRGLQPYVGESRSQTAVAILAERLKQGKTDAYIAETLATLGDERAITPLIERLKAGIKTMNYVPGEGILGTDFARAADALAELKAREAVPILLPYVEYPEVIHDLTEIGDTRAAPAFHELVGAKGAVTRNGRSVNPELEHKRFFSARMALARFNGPDEVLRLAEILADPNFEGHDHYDVVMRLARLRDPRVIPVLVKLVKTETDYYTLSMAIGDLGSWKYKSAVEGLIECFDVPFKVGGRFKRDQATAATYRNEIARSLQRLTDQSFGPDKKQWQMWWQRAGRHGTTLK